MAEEEYTHDEQLDRLERLLQQYRPDGKPFTHADCAREMGVHTKTVQRWYKELAADGRTPKRHIPVPEYSQVERDDIFSRHVDTFEMIRKAILRTERTQSLLDAELGFAGPACPTCGRARAGLNPDGTGKARDPDFLKWQTAFKGGETMNNQIVTLAKLLGQISDNQLVLIQQIDEDVMLIMGELAKLDRATSQRIYNQLIQASIRRRQRLPEFTEFIDVEYRQTDAADKPGTHQLTQGGEAAANQSDS